MCGARRDEALADAIHSRQAWMGTCGHTRDNPQSGRGFHNARSTLPCIASQDRQLLHGRRQFILDTHIVVLRIRRGVRYVREDARFASLPA